MRIALACPYAWDAPGGVQVHVRQLGEELRRRGHEVLVLAPATDRPGESWVRGVARPVAVPFNGAVAPIAPWPGRTIGELRSFHPDVVHAHEPFAPSTGMWATLAARAPVVATFHTYSERSRALAVAAPALRLVWRRIALPIAVSGAAAEFAGRHFAGAFRIVPNGIDVERFASATPAELPEGDRILFVGRLQPRKGFGDAVRAFALLAPRFPGASLVVVGEGAERTALDDLAPGLRARVRMLGVPPYDELPRYHAAAEVFVAPNTGGESFGLVLAEAMAAGLPVVASDIPGFREVVRDGVEGLLVPPRDPQALAAAVARVLGDRSLARRLGEAGRRRADRYRWDRVADEIERAYRDAIAAGARSRLP